MPLEQQKRILGGTLVLHPKCVVSQGVPSLGVLRGVVFICGFDFTFISSLKSEYVNLSATHLYIKTESTTKPSISTLHFISFMRTPWWKVWTLAQERLRFKYWLCYSQALWSRGRSQKLGFLICKSELWFLLARIEKKRLQSVWHVLGTQQRVAVTNETEHEDYYLYDCNGLNRITKKIGSSPNSWKLRMWTCSEIVFVDEIKLRWGDAGIRWALNPVACALMKRGKDAEKVTEPHREGTGRDWSGAATSQEMPGIHRSL